MREKLLETVLLQEAFSRTDHRMVAQMHKRTETQCEAFSRGEKPALLSPSYPQTWPRAQARGARARIAPTPGRCPQPRSFQSRAPPDATLLHISFVWPRADVP